MPGHEPTYLLSYATLNSSLALVVEALNGSKDPDHSAVQLLEKDSACS